MNISELLRLAKSELAMTQHGNGSPYICHTLEVMAKKDFKLAATVERAIDFIGDHLDGRHAFDASALKRYEPGLEHVLCGELWRNPTYFNRMQKARQRFLDDLIAEAVELEMGEMA
jgi:hypothetical protein